MIDGERYDTFLSRWMDDIFGRDAGVILIVALVVICLLATYFLDYKRFANTKDDEE